MSATVTENFAGSCDSGRKHEHDRPKHAFTLLELLVVICTIAVLAVVTVPVLARSGNLSSRTICSNNLRQLGQGMLAYSCDNRDYLPFPNWGNDYRGWLYKPYQGMPPRLLGSSATVLDAYRTGQLFQYVQKQQTYVCPVDFSSKYFRTRANQLSSYVMNGAACGYGNVGANSCKLTDVWSSECYLLWNPDENLISGGSPLGSFAFNDASTYPDRLTGLGRLHTAQGGEILVVGGGVRFVPTTVFQKTQAIAGRNLVWWSPFSSTGR